MKTNQALLDRLVAIIRHHTTATIKGTEAFAVDLVEAYCDDDLGRLRPRAEHALVRTLKQVSIGTWLGEVIRAGDNAPAWAVQGIRIVFEGALSSWASNTLAVVGNDAVHGVMPTMEA